MKRIVIGVALVLALASSFTWAQEDKSRIEMVGIGTIYVPDDDDTYDGGAGMEIQGRFWLTPYIGVALAAGGAGYAIDEQDIYIREPFLEINGELEGTVGLTPMGASLLLRPIHTEKVALTLEGGIRYVFVDDEDTELDLYIAEPGSRTYIEDSLDIENGVVAIAAATVEFNVAKQISLLGGAGYQFDVEKGDVEFYDEELGENELEAFLLQAGVVIRF